MKPDFLINLSPEQEIATCRAIWEDFKRTNPAAWALLFWWLRDLHQGAEGIYLNPDTTPTRRLMALGHEQVLQALVTKMQEVLVGLPEPSGLGVEAEDEDLTGPDEL